MLCKKCNAENPNDAIFCKSCGKRLDGKATCPKCHKEIADDAMFCSYCGVRISQATPTQAPAAKRAATPASTTTSTATIETGEITAPTVTWRKVLSTCGTAFSLAVAVIALIFVFTIGFTLNGSPDFMNRWSQMGMTSAQDISIYDYFGKIYEDIQLALGSFSTQIFVDYNTVSFYLPAVIGTVIAAATIIAVAVLSIIAIVKNAQKLTGKAVKHSEGLAFASFMTFVLGSVALFALNIVSIKARTTSENMNAALTFNGATLAGMILGGIFAVVSLVCLVVSRKINMPIGKFVTNITLTFASSVLMIVTLSCAYSPAFITKISQSSGRVTMCMPASAFTQIWGMSLSSTTDVIDETFVLLCATQIIQIVFVIVAGITLIRFVMGLYNDKLGANLGCSIATTVLSILYLVMAQICIGKITDGQTSASEKMTAAYAIVALVFTLLTLGTSIAKMVVNGVKKQPQDIDGAQDDAGTQPAEQAA